MTLSDAREIPPIRGHFASDTHLFHPRNGAASRHLQMLFASDAQVYYLNGDTIDFTEMESALTARGLAAEDFPARFSDALALLGMRDAEIHLRVIDTLMAKVDSGARVVIIGGNHDPGFDLLDGRDFHGITCRREDLYDAGPGQGRFLVEHGHRFDPAYLQKFSGLYGVGSMFLDAGLMADHALARLVPSLGRSFPVSNALKRIGKGHVNGFIDRAMNKAKDSGADGIICGHIHRQDDRSELRDIFGRVRNGGVRYINSGDGLTHGTTVAHTQDRRWIFLTPADIPAAAGAILAPDNPLQDYRPRSLDFLQAAWKAHLAHIRGAGSTGHSLEFPAPLPRPEVLAA